MHVPPAFQVDDPETLAAIIRAAPLCQFVTATAAGPIATPVPMVLDSAEGELGVLYGHLARPNPQWREPAIGEALAIFMGPDAYISPSWYASKREHGKVVPTWNYEAVQAFGPAEFFEDTDRLLEVVTRLTDAHEQARTERWHVTDAPAGYVHAQLRGIVGIRMPITRLLGKRKVSQNRSLEDRIGVAQGLAGSDAPKDRALAALMPVERS